MRDDHERVESRRPSARDRNDHRPEGPQPRSVLAGDLRYPALTRGWNLRRRGRPREVLLCGSGERVVEALDRAASQGLRVTVRSQGHCPEGFALDNEGGVLLDLSPMERLGYDPATGLLTVEPGVSLARVHRWLFAGHGLALPAPAEGSLGLVSHLLAGSPGPLSRLYGSSVDHLRAVDMVVIARDGRPRTVHARCDSTDAALRELLWAHRGAGGGHFGVVTRFYFAELPTAPAEVRWVTWAWDWDSLDLDRFTSLVDHFGACFAAGPPDGDPWRSPWEQGPHPGDGSTTPGLFARLHLAQRAAGQVVLTLLDAGSDPSVTSACLATFERAVGPPTTARIAPGSSLAPPRTTRTLTLPWPVALHALSSPRRHRRYKLKSAFAKRRLTAPQISVLWVYLSESLPNASAGLRIDSHGFGIDRPDREPNAVAQRSSRLFLRFESSWDDPADDALHLGWIGDFYTALFGPRGPWPDHQLEGCSPAYRDIDLEDWEYLYHGDLYPRLRRVKDFWDPLNSFRHPQSIRPTSSCSTHPEGSDILAP